MIEFVKIENEIQKPLRVESVHLVENQPPDRERIEGFGHHRDREKVDRRKMSGHKCSAHDHQSEMTG